VPLAELQNALAQLYTREDARASFAADPAAFAERFGLGPSDRARLAAIGQTRLHAYADSLDRKRASEAARLLPLSARALSGAFRQAALRYARRVPLADGRSRYCTDAIAFARHVIRSNGAAIGAARCSLLAFEADSLAATSRVPGLRLAAYPYDPFELARALARGDALEACAPARTAVAFAGPFRFRIPLSR
jgi:hypothetical protein